MVAERAEKRKRKSMGQKKSDFGEYRTVETPRAVSAALLPGLRVGETVVPGSFPHWHTPVTMLGNTARDEMRADR